MGRLVLLLTVICACEKSNSPPPTDGGPDISIVPDARRAADASTALCSDQVKNGQELAIDCGGPCGFCNRCGVPGELFCSSFEDERLREFEGTLELGGGSVTITDERVFRGVHSGRTFAPSENEHAAFRAAIDPVDSGMIYARWYMRIESGFSMEGLAVRHSVHLFSDEANWKRIYLFNLRGDRSVELSSAGGPASEILSTEPGTVGTDTWMCIQISLEVNVPDSPVTFSVNGRSQSFRLNTQLNNGAPLQEVVIGPHLEYLSTSNLAILWDDFALATEPIACD